MYCLMYGLKVGFKKYGLKVYVGFDVEMMEGICMVCDSWLWYECYGNICIVNVKYMVI